MSIHSDWLFLLLGGFVFWLHRRLRRLEDPATDTKPVARPPTGKRPAPRPAAPPGPDPHGYRCRGCGTTQDTRAQHHCPAPGPSLPRPRAYQRDRPMRRPLLGATS